MISYDFFCNLRPPNQGVVDLQLMCWRDVSFKRLVMKCVWDVYKFFNEKGFQCYNTLQTESNCCSEIRRNWCFEIIKKSLTFVSLSKLHFHRHFNLKQKKKVKFILQIYIQRFIPFLDYRKAFDISCTNCAENFISFLMHFRMMSITICTYKEYFVKKTWINILTNVHSDF